MTWADVGEVTAVYLTVLCVLLIAVLGPQLVAEWVDLRRDRRWVNRIRGKRRA